MTASVVESEGRAGGAFRFALTDMLAVIGTGLRLLWRHWPVLVALYLAGYVAHALLMKAAVEVSDHNAVLGVLVLVLAPVATLVAFILMLRAVRPSLPWLAGAAERRSVDPDAPRAGLVSQLASVVIPFLTVYASYDYLKQDFSEYGYNIWADESFNNAEIFTNPSSVDSAGRLPSLGVMMVAVLVVAFALRWLADRLDVTRRRPWLGVPAAYAETVWMTLGATAVLQATTFTKDWFADRRIVDVLYNLWYDATGLLGPLTGAVRGTGSWLWGLVSGLATTVLVVPIAWLVVGAVVYGHKLDREPPSAKVVYRLSAARWPSAPKPLLHVLAEVGGFAGRRFATLFRSLRLLFRAGLLPMLLFCLAFVLASVLVEWLWELERLLIGPNDLWTFWMPWSGPLDVLNQTVMWVVLACLLAGAIDRVLRVQLGGARPAGQAAPTEPDDPVGRERASQGWPGPATPQIGVPAPRGIAEAYQPG